MIIFISGGERSGKSRYAQELALSKTDTPYYLATSKIWDDDFEERVKRHQQERDERWTNIEEQFELAKVLPENGVVVVDCVTLWLTNYFSKCKGDKEAIMKEAKAEAAKLFDYKGVLIIITNELGMGLHASTKAGRDFVECQGWINQFIAANAEEAYFMVSGIPLKVK